jgi:hypothetical protein
VPRSRWVQFLACSLLFLGVSAVPGWEVAHVLEHRQLRDHVEAEPPTPLQGQPDDARLTHPHENHQHLILSAPLRPSGGLSALWVALPSVAAPVRFAVVTAPAGELVLTEARAGPGRHRSTQPRAPPLL